MTKNSKIVFGIDEVGRGPLAGAVFACAITAPAGLKIRNESLKIKIQNSEFSDSKKLNQRQREEIYEALKKNPSVKWGIGRISEKVIDEVNILQATKLAMIKAVRGLEKKIARPADLLLIDGNFSIDVAREQQSIIRGDEKMFLIALASIVAKVERDRFMLNAHKKYPQYGFDRHKGYGTRLHIEMIKRLGPCPLHRQTFAPINKPLI
ncbi:MAG: ribonuclease HII [Candidatus Pacebacteria bacterium]|nr:ribonuclease HII [Candidatus Paceibacterota bacterium]